MQTVQHTKHFAHPTNWAGFILVGGNIRLSNKVALIGQALCELIKTPEKCRDALRVCLHLVRKTSKNENKNRLVNLSLNFTGGKEFTTNSSWPKECNVYHTEEH